MGDCILSTVRKAARLAVYDEMMMSVKNHQTLPTIRPDIDLNGNRLLFKSRVYFTLLSPIFYFSVFVNDASWSLQLSFEVSGWLTLVDVSNELLVCQCYASNYTTHTLTCAEQ